MLSVPNKDMSPSFLPGKAWTHHTHRLLCCQREFLNQFNSIQLKTHYNWINRSSSFDFFSAESGDLKKQYAVSNPSSVNASRSSLNLELAKWKSSQKSPISFDNLYIYNIIDLTCLTYDDHIQDDYQKSRTIQSWLPLLTKNLYKFKWFSHLTTWRLTFVTLYGQFYYKPDIEYKFLKNNRPFK